MLSFGLWEMALVVTVALIFVGPERLPTMVRFLGRQYGKLMRASNDLRRAFILEADRVDSEVRSEQLKKLRLDALDRAKKLEKTTAASEIAEDEPPYQVAPVHRGEGEYVPFDLNYHGSESDQDKSANDEEISKDDKDQLN